MLHTWDCVFNDVESEMRGLEWGRLYETYKKNKYFFIGGLGERENYK